MAVAAATGSAAACSNVSVAGLRASRYQVPVCGVDAGGADPHEHVAVAGDGRLEVEHVGSSVPLLDDGAHRAADWAR
jgi:hypothetical protein